MSDIDNLRPERVSKAIHEEFAENGVTRSIYVCTARIEPIPEKNNNVSIHTGTEASANSATLPPRLSG